MLARLMSPSSWAARRLAVIAMLVTALLFAMGTAGASKVSAQEGEAKPAAEGTTATEGEAEKPPESTLMWLIHTSGLIGLFLLLISIYFVAKVIQLFMTMRPEVVAPPELVADCEDKLAKRDYNGIYQAAKASPSEYGTLVSTGLASMGGGMDEVRETIDRTGEAINVEMEKQISMLAVIGSLGPMIGLLGTLKGMIASFSVIATSSAALKPSEVAGGISEALVLTFEGVILSVPAIYFYAVFKNKGSHLAVQVHNMAEAFLRKVHASAQRPAAAPAAAPPK